VYIERLVVDAVDRPPSQQQLTIAISRALAGQLDSCSLSNVDGLPQQHTKAISRTVAEKICSLSHLNRLT
jgi:hypothetical protein